MPSPVWLSFCTSLAGTARRRRATPCQDASASRRLGDSGEIVLLALSDGAGSASHSDLGAQTVVSHWLDAFTTLLHQCPDPDAALAESAATTLRTMLTTIRNSVEKDALAFEASPSDFSATLLGAVLTPSGQTVFATSESAPYALQMVRLSHPPSALVGFTDGLERLLLDFRTQLAAEGFFRPLLQGLKASPQTFGAHLEEYLESAAVCERTDDDKSIAIALNSHADF
jgi:hypothetical protein